jgi:hypothetical protein
MLEVIMEKTIEKLKKFKKLIEDFEEAMGNASPEEREQVHGHLYNFLQDYKKRNPDLQRKIDQVKAERNKPKPTIN